MASREAVGAFVSDRTNKDGRVSGSALKNFARLANFDREPYMKALEVSELYGCRAAAVQLCHGGLCCSAAVGGRIRITQAARADSQSQ